jgi:acetate kinase
MTTMGFTPLDGLVMATRSGSIDPGAVLWLAEHTDEDLGRVLEEESGLLGLAGTPDLSEVLVSAAEGGAEAELALAVYRHRLLREVGGCLAVLGGLDALVLTGGVGENVVELRQWLGDPLTRLLGHEVPILVVEAREDLQMAREATVLLAA